MTFQKSRFQFCLDSNENLLDIRVIQDHSGGALNDPELLHYNAIPLGWKEYLFHVGSSSIVHSIKQAELIVGGKDTKEGRQSVFLAALIPTDDELNEEYEDMTNPRKVYYKNMSKSFQHVIKWTSLRKTQDKGSEFWQTPSDAIILYDTVSADCIERVVNTSNYTDSEELSSSITNRFPRESNNMTHTASLKQLLRGPKTPADIWTRLEKKLNLTLSHAPRGNGTKTTGSFPWTRKIQLHSWQRETITPKLSWRSTVYARKMR